MTHEPTEQHLTRRNAPRYACDHKIRLEKDGVSYEGVAVDVSRMGASIRILDLTPDQFEEVLGWADANVNMQFVEAGILVAGAPVRADVASYSENVLVAFQFASTLTTYECNCLGVNAT